MNADRERLAVQYLIEGEPNKVWRTGAIASVLGLRGKQLKRLQGILVELTRSGAIAQIKAGQYRAAADTTVSGRLTVVRNGAGYVVDKASGQAVWIQHEDQGTAMPGDTVTLRVTRGLGDEPRGKITQVEARAERDIVGTLSALDGQFYVTPLDPAHKRDFVIGDPRDARAGDRVVVRLTEWRDRSHAPQGEIVDVIGPADQPSLDTEVICRQYDLPRDFTPAVVRQAERVGAQLAAPGERLDLRDLFVLTIDPAKARDFDDALSLQHDAQGRRVLGVHIADVGHFVRPGSALDAEARERGNSVYLVDKVIPMLPEQLSNGVCSLRPDEDRLTFSALLTFDEQGVVVERRFAKTIIRSKLRLAYEQALQLMETGKTTEQRAIPAATVPLLRDLNQLAKQLRARRMQAGALELASTECEILLDANARMTGVRLSPSDESHQLIEECMVAANEAVATELTARGLTIIERLHEPPDDEKIDELQAALALLGIRAGDLHNQKHLARFLATTADNPLKHHIHTLVLRSLKRAIYSAEATGHFGLAKKYYAHFTSPIRRYPDLTLHRQLADYLAKAPTKGSKKMTPAQLKVIAEHCTEMEQRADEASRALIEIKKFRFLQQQLDEKKPLVYDAVVSRLATFGIFIDVTELQLTALIHVSTLPGRYARYNQATETLSAGDKTFKIGDRLRAFVSTVDFNQRRADFTLAGDDTDAPPVAAGTAPPRRGKKPRTTAAATARPQRPRHATAAKRGTTPTRHSAHQKARKK